MTSIIIKATLKNIRYAKENFIIGMFFNNENKDVFGGLGDMLRPIEGAEYQLSGKWLKHPEYGEQFQFGSYRVVEPNNINGIFKYLIRVAKGVGPSIASKLVDLYGEETLKVLREDPNLVAAEISGITEKKALEIQDNLLELELEESTIVELMDILNIPGLRKSLPMELYQKFGLNAAEILKKNPYVICQFVGSGFLIADRLALQRLNVPADSMFRIKAAIEYAMDQDLHSNGNTWIPAEQLIQAVVELTSIEDLKRILLGIEELTALEAIVETPGGNGASGGWLALWEVDQDESYVASKIKEMVKP